MQIEGVNLLDIWPGIFLGSVAVAVVVLYFRKANKARADLYASRSDRSLNEIYEAYFANCVVAEEQFEELWQELADVLEAPAGKLLPSDRFQIDLAPPKGFEFDDQINDVMYMINKKCQYTGVNPERIKTVKDYIIAFGSP